MKKHTRKNWKHLKVHPMLHRHIMGSPILAPMAMPPEDEATGAPENEPDADDSLPSNPFSGSSGGR